MHSLRTWLPLALLGIILFSLHPESVWAADPPGQIPPGEKWEFIIAAYVVTWLGITGYTISLWVRTPKKKRQ